MAVTAILFYFTYDYDATLLTKNKYLFSKLSIKKFLENI